MDIIQQAIEGMGRVLAKIFFGKEDKYELVLEQAASASEIGMIVNARFAAGDYNGAENIIFEQLEQSFDFELYYLAVDFFARLNKLTDEQLAKGNYERGEIVDGLNDLQELLQSRWGAAIDE